MKMKRHTQRVVGAVPLVPGALLLTNSDSSQCQPKGDDRSHRFRKNSVLRQVNKLGKKADLFTQSFREHVRLSPNISETLKGKMRLGARILQMGGTEKVFKTLFNVCEKERLLKASQCYLSTTAGPIAGVLFISTRNIAFCSERSLKMSCPNGATIRVHYKVLIPLSKIEATNQSKNVENPSQKYIQIITVDNFDFWFMGFLNYQKTWKHLQQAIFLEPETQYVIAPFGH